MWLTALVDNTICYKTSKSHESSKSSTWRELTAVQYGFARFPPYSVTNQHFSHLIISQQHILLNLGVKRLICKLQPSTFTRYICSITPQWVLRSENVDVDADSVSKLIDYDDWCTADHLFSFLNQLIDLF